MTTLTEDTLANPGILADLLRPVRRLDELAEIKDEYRAKTAAIPQPKEPMK